MQGLVENPQARTRLKGYAAPRESTSESLPLRQLEGLYSFRNAVVVRRFLRIHPQLIEVLLKAHTYLQKHFGPDPKVALEVISDPEAEGGDQLFAYILTPLPVDRALAQLNRMDEEWFLDQLDRTDGLLNFNLELGQLTTSQDTDPQPTFSSTKVYMKMMDSWATAFEEEATLHTAENLDSLYDDAYFEAMELQRKLP